MRHATTSLLCAGALLIGTVACSDDDEGTSVQASSTSTTASEDGDATSLAKGVDVELVGSNDLGSQTLNISAEQQGGEVTGEFRVTEVVVRLDCAETDTDGVIILGGQVTTGDDGDPSTVGELLALIIREGDPDSVALVGNDANAGSCRELLESIPEGDLIDDSRFTDVEDGHDIQTS